MNRCRWKMVSMHHCDGGNFSLIFASINSGIDWHFTIILSNKKKSQNCLDMIFYTSCFHSSIFLVINIIKTLTWKLEPILFLHTRDKSSAHRPHIQYQRISSGNYVDSRCNHSLLFLQSLYGIPSRIDPFFPFLIRF